MSQQLVHSDGIFHGLPVFPDDIQGLTAVITGANGISGSAMLRALLKSPTRWSKIICLSRRPPYSGEKLPGHVEHVPVDFLDKPADIASTLEKHNVRDVDYIFFFAYIQPPPKDGMGIWSDADELTRVNKDLLSNFIEAIKIAKWQPKRFMLQTGVSVKNQ
jgi:nucleoside-diphosphate-sugar epimerase